MVSRYSGVLLSEIIRRQYRNKIKYLRYFRRWTGESIDTLLNLSIPTKVVILLLRRRPLHHGAVVQAAQNRVVLPFTQFPSLARAHERTLVM